MQVQAIGEAYRPGGARLITNVLKDLKLYVHQGEGKTTLQNVRGVDRRIGEAAWCTTRAHRISDPTPPHAFPLHRTCVVNTLLTPLRVAPRA